MAMQLWRGALLLMAVVSILFPWRGSHRGLGDDLHTGYRARHPAGLSAAGRIEDPAQPGMGGRFLPSSLCLIS
jgi:hypothetical protein